MDRVRVQDRLMAPWVTRRHPFSRPRNLLIAFAVWTLYSILTLAYVRFFARVAHDPAQPLWPGVVRWTLQGWVWMLLAFPILALSARRPFRRGAYRRAIVAHVLGFLVVQVLLGLVDWLVAFGFYRVSNTFLFMFQTTRFNAIVYALIVASEHAWRNGRASAEGAVETAELRQKLAEAQLEMLRAQLQPHFLFNALHDISE